MVHGQCPIDHGGRPSRRGGALDLLLENLPPGEAADEIRTLIGAGATTGHLLSWICDLLARHPQIQSRLRGAIGETAPADLDAVPYLTAVVQEGLRLYPPAPFLLRRDGRGRRAVHLVSVYGMHRDPDYWPRPEAFHPERWLDADGRLRAGVGPAFVPFGMGPRICIGKRFALVEAQIILAGLLRRFELAPAGRSPPRPVLTILTRPDRAIEVEVRARSALN
jgi:cytochrome P450